MAVAHGSTLNLERELARERKNERALAEFEAMRAEAYKYNF